MESQKYTNETIHGALVAYYSAKQEASTSNAEYLSIVKAVIEAIKHYGASVGNHPILIDEELKLAGDEENKGRDIA
jgi:hypothetical protein